MAENLEATNDSAPGNNDALTDHELNFLRDLRHRLLHLHKSLLDIERVNHEKVFGQVNSGELLQLVINHPQFAWLRAISALVVEIDEALDADEPATSNEMRSLVTQARSLFISQENEEFREKYQAVLQNDPDVVMEHAGVMKLLRPGSSD
jgi:hypothetical protein